MTSWTEDISKCTLEELFRSQVENRAWYKEIRRKASAVMDSKLAKEIGPEEYAEKRKVSIEDVAECGRRGRILANEAIAASADRRRVVR
jgi:hypothetical protein